jgi:hypothetical protein
MKRYINSGWSLDNLFNNKFFVRFCLNLGTFQIKASNFHKIVWNDGSVFRNTAVTM